MDETITRFLLQKLVPFLKACSVEYCVGKSNYGSCKKSSHKFTKVWP